MMLGEAAGEAAVMAVQQAGKGVTVQTLDTEQLRSRLRQQGAIVDPPVTVAASAAELVAVNE